MHENSCRRDDIIMAFEDLSRRLAERRQSLWSAYGEATQSMSRNEYEEHESECWSVLRAGLSGIDAEERVLRRDFESRLTSFDGPEAVADSA